MNISINCNNPILQLLSQLVNRKSEITLSLTENDGKTQKGAAAISAAAPFMQSYYLARRRARRARLRRIFSMMISSRMMRITTTIRKRMT